MVTNNCTAFTVNSVPYEELSCLYPQLAPTYLSFEKDYDVTFVHLWMQTHNFVPILACFLYYILIFSGKFLMKEKKPWKWRKALAAWNLGLSIFSWIGMFRTAPQLLHNLLSMSLRDNLCRNPQEMYGSGSTGLWIQLFVLSKFPELVDTFFIVIHKKPLLFLHWYHHITVLLYCWHSYTTSSPSGIFFATMNYSVHAMMYGYYFLMAIRKRPKWFNPIAITCLQITQMIIGVVVTLASFYYYIFDKNSDEPCQVTKENNGAAFLMYGSYLFLFVQFFVGRYIKIERKSAKMA